MPGTSSASSCRSSATGAPSCSARWWAATACGATSSSRAPGRTPFSRGGDGRAALGPVLREYIVSEAMAALGIPTTRALAAVTTGEAVLRETALPGAVLTRVAASHIRVGTFQYLRRARRRGGAAAAGRPRHRPPLPGGRAARRSPTARCWRRWSARQAELVARWLLVGFIHGVMNTDNISIAGETIDYGPCAFMDAYDPGHGVQLDRPARPLRLRQPAAHRAVEPRAAGRDAAAAAGRRTRSRRWRRRKEALGGLRPALRGGLPRRPAAQARPRSRRSEGDAALAQDLLERMAENEADFTLTFRRLCDAAAGPEGDAAVRGAVRRSRRLRRLGRALAPAAAREDRRAPAARRAAMRAVNPAFIPRNHRVEAAIEAAVERQDFGPFEELLEVVARPYEDRPGPGVRGARSQGERGLPDLLRDVNEAGASSRRRRLGWADHSFSQMSVDLLAQRREVDRLGQQRLGAAFERLAPASRRRHRR